jgi:3-isopropylmalate/(R)-2-methylmalate dehydratase small subunit
MATPFVRIEGPAIPLAVDNIDTDAIIPSRETQSVARTGYAEKLFANWRYRPGTREVNPDFVLNLPKYRGAIILVSRRNFGCGSSREAAVWSLAQYGIRCVVAESYGTIFRNNCIRNGVLPATLPVEEIEDLLTQLEEVVGTPVMAVDLQACTIVGPDGRVYRFQIAGRDREMLLSGADEIALTLARREQIDAFRGQDRAKRPWIYSRPGATGAAD